MAYSQNHTQALDNFYIYMSDILARYQDLIPMLKDEFDAIVSDDTATLDSLMNSQQAVLLTTRKFDENVESYTRDIEVPASNLTELIENLPADDAQRFVILKEDFRVTIEEVLFYRNKCRELLSSKLHTIGTILDATGGPKESTTYDSTASEVQSSLFPKSFQTSI